MTDVDINRLTKKQLINMLKALEAGQDAAAKDFNAKFGRLSAQLAVNRSETSKAKSQADYYKKEAIRLASLANSLEAKRSFANERYGDLITTSQMAISGVMEIMSATRPNVDFYPESKPHSVVNYEDRIPF